MGAQNNSMKKLLTAVAAALVLLSCNKDVEELPPATDTGAQTFGARVDGKFWIPKGFGVVPTSPILEARFENTNNLVINARNFAGQPTETEFEIYLFNVTGPGTYNLNVNTGKYPGHSGNYAYYIERKFHPLNEWITNSQYTGTVRLTKVDRENKIVAGTFEFNAITMEGDPKPLSVTDGRFDVKTQ
jgi:hypothetical protein